MTLSNSNSSIANTNEASQDTHKTEESRLRIIESIVAPPSADLAKCILSWVVSAPRPLSVDELTEGVKLDIGQSPPSPTSQHLESATGPLIVVDDQSRVRIADKTTSTFLTKPREDGGPLIDPFTTHSRISQICLEILGGTEFAPPKRQEGRLRQTSKPLTPLAAYAAAHFAFHLTRASPAANEHLAVLDKFLRTNVLTWIERLAELGDLVGVIGGARAIETYLRTPGNSRIDGETAQVGMAGAWVTDIHRFVALFHSAILTMPSSVHLSLPQLCPRNSTIRKLFGTPTEDLKIVGHLDEDWDDRLTCYRFPNLALSVACCERLVAIGISDNDIRLYNPNTFELVATLPNGRRAQFLAFDSSSSFLVSCDLALLELWDVRQPDQSPCHRVWERILDFVPEGLELSPDEKSIVLFNPERSELVTVSVTDGLRGDIFSLYEPLGPDNDPDDWTQRPAQVRLNASHTLAAALCANSLVVLWDLKLQKMAGTLEPEPGTEDNGWSEPTPSRYDMLFHPVSEIELLAISGGWGVATYHPRTLEQTAQCRLSDPVHHLAATSDGRLLAAEDRVGVIHLFLFETLRPLYRIQPPDLTRRLSNIVFSSDNSRVFAIRGQCCNVWEPPVLKLGDSLPNEAPVEREPQPPLLEPGGRRKISFIHPTKTHFFFVGRYGGVVEVWDTETGTEIQELRPELPGDIDWLGGSTHCLDWNESERLLLVSNGRDCIVSRLAFHHTNHNNHNTPSPPTTSTTLLHHHASTIIHQALLSPSGTTAVLRTHTSLTLLAIPSDTTTTTTTTTTIVTTLPLPLSSGTSTTTYLAHHPTDPALLVATTPTHIHLLHWQTLARRSPEAGIPLCGTPPFGGGYTYGYGHGAWNSPAWFSGGGGRGESAGFLARLVTAPPPERGDRVVGVAVVGVAGVALGGGGDGQDAGGTEAEMRLLGYAALAALTVPASAVIGVRGAVLYFFDATGWVCSLELGQARCYRRHFFVPPTWHPPGGGAARVPVALVSEKAVAFSRGEGPVVFHGGLELGEEVPLREDAVVRSL